MCWKCTNKQIKTFCNWVLGKIFIIHLFEQAGKQRESVNSGIYTIIIVQYRTYIRCKGNLADT